MFQINQIASFEKSNLLSLYLIYSTSTDQKISFAHRKFYLKLLFLCAVSFTSNPFYIQNKIKEQVMGIYIQQETLINLF